MNGTRTCSFEGCDKPHEARGYCNGHYKQKTLGKPLTAFRHDPPLCYSIEQRMDFYTDKSGACWLWTGTRINAGYGLLCMNSKKSLAHRVSFELAYGPIPTGVFIDHMCHTKSCVNPQHLRLATKKQNAENMNGLAANNSSGVRGVNWYKNRWCAKVGHNGQQIYVGRFVHLADAEAAVVAKRNELFTHNDQDRLAAGFPAVSGYDERKWAA